MQGHAKAFKPEKSSIFIQAYNAGSHSGRTELKPEKRGSQTGEAATPAFSLWLWVYAI